MVLERIQIRGYKSFRELDIGLEKINVLIGANGSGKSNFISLFLMLNRLVNRDLQPYVARSGGGDQLLHYGRKATDELHIEVRFRPSASLTDGYRATLLPTADDLLVFGDEACYFRDRERGAEHHVASSSVHPESLLPRWQETERGARRILEAIQSWRVYHFHDTSASAKVKQTGDLHDNLFLRSDASNLAAYLYLLRETEPAAYRNIVETVRMAAPFFGDFVLRPSPFNQDKIRLEWQERGSDMLFGPHTLSDGTLRFICLSTLFLQPPKRLPTVIVLDEPELGLHPHALALLAEMVRSSAEHTQIILATQSVTLVNQFSPQDIIVVDRVEGVSHLRRLPQEEISSWLEDYGLGDLWEKNLLGGRPSR